MLSCSWVKKYSFPCSFTWEDEWSLIARIHFDWFVNDLNKKLFALKVAERSVYEEDYNVTEENLGRNY